MTLIKLVMTLKITLIPIFISIAISGCSSAFVDAYTDEILGKDLIENPSEALALGFFTKNLEHCKKSFHPETYARYKSDYNWLESYVNTNAERESYLKGYRTETQKLQPCDDFIYSAAELHQEYLQLRRQEAQREQRQQSRVSK
ncbi:hypothetical protein DBZ36_01115 [Alginatibacterium sediminis]|uniref:Lipoprotein n=1 Tax=Alginatibacterium sediminis TaxID=2164068 RepID=A0A420ENI6_9ALTE|nr:hypothetical protein [Alginatibacterium sediminis]RKF22277.1 hypothetical protein DBZ36_01115 [Alginatibacterium sediminis]